MGFQDQNELANLVIFVQECSQVYLILDFCINRDNDTASDE